MGPNYCTIFKAIMLQGRLARASFLQTPACDRRFRIVDLDRHGMRVPNPLSLQTNLRQRAARSETARNSSSHGHILEHTSDICQYTNMSMHTCICIHVYSYSYYMCGFSKVKVPFGDPYNQHYGIMGVLLWSHYPGRLLYIYGCAIDMYRLEVARVLHNLLKLLRDEFQPGRLNLGCSRYIVGFRV